MTRAEDSPFRCDGRWFSNQRADAATSGKVSLGEKGLGFSPDAPLLTYAGIEAIHAQDYRIDLTLESGETLVIDRLGYCYDDFVRELRRRWEPLRLRKHLAPGGDRLLVDVALGILRPSAGPVIEQRAALRLSETALAWIPAAGAVSVIPLAAISAIETPDWQLRLTLDDGGSLEFRGLGDRLKPLAEEIAEARSQLRQAHRLALATLLDGLREDDLEAASLLLADGRGVSVASLTERLPRVWQLLQERLREARGADELAAALAQGHAEAAMIGLKRGLMGSLSGSDLFLLVPYWGKNATDPGNAVGFSSFALAREEGEEGGGRAELFFRLADRPDYLAALAGERIEALARASVARLAGALRVIHFRREPIFMAPESLRIGDLSCPEAADRLPELAFLRASFLGRVVHQPGSDSSSWRKFLLPPAGEVPGKE